MKIPMQITIRNMEHTAALEAYIREKAQKLDEFFTHIMSCRVVVEMQHKHQNKGMQFNVRIDISVPGNEIVISREHSEDVNVALRDAFNAAKRKVESYACKVQGVVKTHEHRRRYERDGLLSQ
jgi:ribosomal subunit interface protein